ncbi:putative elongation factor 1-gamma (EF-1-gamma) [Trypanosoma cruzi]|nr:putative elongation factor 1-gamma (EF-1-gamma) [Trypanosoma cruzi]
MQKECIKMRCMTANMVGRVVAAHGARAQLRVGRCAHDCGGEAARQCGAVCVARSGHAGDCEGRGGHGAAGLREEWRTLRRSGNAWRTACAGRARRSRGLRWRGAC